MPRIVALRGFGMACPEQIVGGDPPLSRDAESALETRLVRQDHKRRRGTRIMVLQDRRMVPTLTPQPAALERCFRGLGPDYLQLAQMKAPLGSLWGLRAAQATGERSPVAGLCCACFACKLVLRVGSCKHDITEDVVEERWWGFVWRPKGDRPPTEAGRRAVTGRAFRRASPPTRVDPPRIARAVPCPYHWRLGGQCVFGFGL